MADPARELLRLGIDHQLNGRNEAAEACYRQALPQAPDDVDLLNNLGLLLFEKGDLEEAEPFFLQALRVQPEFVAARYNLGRNYLEKGDLAAALGCFDQVLSIRPDDADTYVALAVCLERQGKFDDAEEYFHDAAAFSPTYVLARHIRFGESFFRSLADAAQSDADDVPRTLDECGGAPEYVALVACDSAYFDKYGTAFISSFRSSCSGDAALLHVHIVNPVGGVIERAKQLLSSAGGMDYALTMESLPDLPGLREAAVYYSCARFIHLPAWLQHYRKPIVVLDVDAVIEAPLRRLIDAVGEADIGLNQRVPKRAPWLDIKAGFVVARPTPLCALYFRLVSEFIRHFIEARELHWQLDQIALYCALVMTRRFSTPARSALASRCGIASVADWSSLRREAERSALPQVFFYIRACGRSRP